MQNNVQLPLDQQAFKFYQSGYAYKCFPVRSVKKFNPDDGGAWLVELKSEKRRQLEALARTNYVRKKKQAKKEEKPVTEFTGYYLVKQYCIDEPSDLCSINISGKNLHPSTKEDFSLFNNVITIDASDNNLTFESFQSFPKLEELQLQVNGISCIHATHNDFSTLCKLNASYNTLKEQALLNLGKLRNLKELELQGCGLTKLPAELARGYLVSEDDTDEKKEKCENKRRFPELTHLNLSENELTDISTFASVAGLLKLKSLNLSSNKITGVPHLRLMVAQKHFSVSTYANNSSSQVLSSVSGISKATKKSSRSQSHSLLLNVSKVSRETKSLESCAVSRRTSPNMVIMGYNGTGIDRVSKSADYVGINKNKDPPVEITFLKEMKPIAAYDGTNIEEKSNVYKNDTKHSSNSSLNKSADAHTAENDSILKTSDDISTDINETDPLLKTSDDISTDINETDTLLKTVDATADIDNNIDVDIDKSVNDADVDNDGIDIDKAINQADADNTIAVDIDKAVNKADVDNDNDEDIDKAVNEFLLASDADEEEAQDILSMDFGKELNFSLTGEDDSLGLFKTSTEEDSEMLNADDIINDEIKQPFLSLEILDLSNNDIKDEESLLALTAWPLLRVLNLWDNPLMKTFNGMPPVVYHHLQKMCGIKIHRKQPKKDTMKKPIAPVIAPSIKAHRVKADLPPIKRNNLLMIEAAIANAIEMKKEKITDNISDENNNVEEMEKKKEGGGDGVHQQKYEGEQIFLTQVDEEEVVDNEKYIIGQTKKKSSLKKESIIDKKYKGYELLLKSDGSALSNDDYDLPATIQGSVNALKHLLEHPLVFNEGEYNENKVKVHKQNKNKKSKAIKKRRSVNEPDEVSAALDYMLHNDTAYEENLDYVLRNFNEDPSLRKKFPEAKKMVQSVQEKYDQVRLNSLRPVSRDRSDLSRASTRTDKPSQELILSRMKQNKIGEIYSASRGSTPRTKFRGTTPVINK